MNNEGNILIYIGIFLLLAPIFLGILFGGIYLISLITWTTGLLIGLSITCYIWISIYLIIIGVILKKE